MLYDLFTENIEKNKLIKKNDRILFLHSLGKDASVLMDLLCQYKMKMDFELIPVLFRVPQHVYDNKDEVMMILEHWKSKGHEINIIDFDYEDTFWERSDKVDANKLPCSRCRDLRNEQIKIAIDKYKPNSVACGFNLTDLQNYLVTMMLISNFTFDSNSIIDETTAKRFESLIPRFFVDVQSNYDSLLHWILPLLTIESAKLKQYLEEKKVPYIKTECIFKSQRARSVFSDYVNKLHLNYNFNTDYSYLMKFLQKNLANKQALKVSDNWLNKGSN